MFKLLTLTSECWVRVCVYVLPRQGLWLFEMMPETCVSVQLNNVMLSRLLQCLCQFPSSPFLNLSYFTSKDENSIHRKLERKRYVNDATQKWMKLYKFYIWFSWSKQKPTCDDKILKLKRLLLSKLFHFASGV